MSSDDEDEGVAPGRHQQYCMEQVYAVLELEGAQGCNRQDCKFEHIDVSELASLQEGRCRRECTSKRLNERLGRLGAEIWEKIKNIRSWK